MLRRLRAGVRPADGWLALGFVLADAVEAVVRYHGDHGLLISNLFGSLAFSCLALRRTHPVLTMSAMTVIFSLGSVIQAAVMPQRSGDQFVPIFALLVVTYSLGAYATARQLRWAAWQPVVLVLTVDVTEGGESSLAGAAVFIVVFVSAAPIVAGRLVRGRSVLVGRLREQAAQIEAQRPARVQAAVAADRLAMTNRFHETLLSGMQNLVGRLSSFGSGADELAIGQIEHAARELLSQTRQEVVALTSPATGTAAPPGPSPPTGASADAPQPWTVLAGGALCAGLLVETRSLPMQAPAPIAWLACVAVAIPLALAWLRPLLMITALWLLSAVFTTLVAPLSGSFTAIGLCFVPPFVVAALEPRRRALVGLVVCCAGELTVSGRHAAAGNAAVVVCCWLAGAVLHERISLVDQLRVNNRVLDEQRSAAATQAVAQERLRVARELHDAVGHSLTVIALQAGAARRICPSEPARACAVLRTISAVAAEGLAELQRGSSWDEAGDVADRRSVDDLLDTARAAGLRLDARLDDVAASLAPDGRLAVYRVVQEALTNILKHAPGASAEVVIRDSGSYVDVAITNSASGRAEPASSGGHGLRGMRERVEACGGQLTWSACSDGGFEVRAQVPALVAAR